MRALDRKLLRDLKGIRAQALTIALVVASGLGGFIGSLSTVESLGEGRDRYYAQARLADVFTHAKRAPDAVGVRIAELPEVAEVQTGLVFGVQLDLPGVSQPLTGRMIGTDPSQWAGGLNRLSLRSGRWPSAGTNEVLVNEAFANARGLAPGAEVFALLNGRRQRLSIAGIALSPEYVFAAATGGLPDDTSFGVLWIDRARLAAAFDMEGAFNTLSVKLRAGASIDAAIAEIDRRLEPYGSRGAYDREDQPSHKAVTQEIREQRVFGVLLPSVFLAVAVFVLNVVLDRQVTTQRDQIAALKALGYENRTIVAHYLMLAALIVAAGIVLGIGVGDWFGRYMTRMYNDFFRFPSFYYAVAPWTVAGGAVTFLVAALAGAWAAVRRLVALAPAEAMRPPAPPVFRPLLVERIGLGARFGPQARMILRNLQRRGGRALLTTVGVASAVAILIGGIWWPDALDYLLDVQFAHSQPGEIYLGFTDPVGERVRHELPALPGVLRAEVRRSIAVRIHAGHRSYRSSLTGLAEDAQLWRLLELDGRPIPAPAAGILMTDRLADILGVRPGDTVRLEFLEGRRREPEVIVAGLSRELMGLGAYMEAQALQRLAGEGPVVSTAGLLTDGSQREELFAALKRMPHVAGVFVKSALIEYFRSTSARNILFFTTVLTVFAAAIAVGVVYNSARIALAERAWELATLRVLGLTHREVTVLLLGELAIEMLVAIPLGFVGGYHLVDLMLSLMSSESFRIPPVILPSTYAYAGLTMLAAGVVSAWIVQRRLADLDLIAVLKTRE
jgi:putative ABC transport system permease protein